MVAKQKQGMAALEEWLQQKYVEYFDDSDQYVNKVELLSSKLTDLLLTNSSSRKYIIYNGKTHYLLNKKFLPNEIKEQLVGGDTNTPEDFVKLIDVYGITTDLKVYYIDTLNNIQYGNMNVEDVNPDLPMPKLNSDSIMGGIIKEALKSTGVTIDESKGITIDNVSKISSLTIDGEKNKVTSLDALSELLNLQELTLKNLTLENLNGIETLGMLNYIYLDNCKITDYSKMANVLKLKYLFFYFPSSMNTADANVQITNFREGMKNATRIDGLEYLYILGNNTDIFWFKDMKNDWGTSGNGKMLEYMTSDLSNLTDVSGLGKLPNNVKTTVKELYLNNHKIGSIESLSGFTGLQNLIIPCNPNLHSLKGLENKKNLLYIAGQQSVVNENVGFESLDGLNGCSSLLYLVLFNNKNLQSISGIKDAKSLSRLLARNCNILSTDGLQGADGLGLDSLLYIDLANNVNLQSVSHISLCDGIKELYLAGCINMIDDEAIGLESTINRCGSKYSIPQKYSLGFSNITTQDISGSDFTDEQLENFRNKTNIKRLRLKNCTSLTNEKINNVLSTMTGLQYLSLEGTSNLLDINFVDYMNLIELDISGTKVTNLSPLNDDSSLKLSSLRLKSTTINSYQILLKNLFNATQAKSASDVDRWNGKYSFDWEGLILTNSGQTVNVPNGITKFSVGNRCQSTTFNLSACENLKSVYLGSPNGKFIMPASLEEINLEVAGTPDLDLSSCTSLHSLSLLQGGDDTWAIRCFSTLPKNNVVNSIEIRRHKLTNLNFLSSFDTNSLTSLVVQGWSESISMNSTLTSLSGIENANELTDLKIRYSVLNNLIGLDRLTNLETLDLQYNKLDSTSEVANIANCTKLTSLTLNNNEISSVGFMSSLTKLTTANLSSNSFSELPDLTNLMVLNMLDISNCKNITDLKPLEKLIKNNITGLKTLNLENCSGIESSNSTTGYSNTELIDKLRKAGCSSITTTGTRL